MFIKKKVAIIGVTGYVGLDLTYMLSKHKKIDIKYLCAQSNIGKNISFFDSRIKKKLPKISNISKIKWDEINLVFLSLPSGKAQKIIKSKYNKYKNLIFIDLSADFRIHDPKEFKRWYGINHQAQSLIKKSIYSISEFVKDDIKNYRIISNPGCYPTSIQLPLMPLLKNKLIHRNNITIDSKSGYSGAGKNFKNKFKHRNLLNSAVAYSVNKHRHMSELDQETQDCLDCFQQGIDKYLLQDWDGALSLFEKAKNLEPNKPGVTPGVKDNPSMILIDRCQIMKDNPPGDDWDGVYVMTTK